MARYKLTKEEIKRLGPIAAPVHLIGSIIEDMFKPKKSKRKKRK